ncbi:alpha/beta fold hydrolase [Oharaeibacter diazotrophicus]|uniref:Pyruvate dehydrogenase E2 component (Dihydrolipoamide acetyltransferase) n=2 Tax=Oharaeibacter diazotrophicus TaxID=1920512 RepID=A0A4R6RDN0_9HYPH|nr:alpha/beta fold hydrolase [Oharaeibacter diazotrophicus]TDP84175.1 pyruvate dehydrogenase E2 component (dihydrolipoamide acetyltransferase) [Oharaeibacter diazotrophicus]BBE73212.1 dihydrolipoyllysine-residue acetyltransferase component of acetoin cleaving system [Pleomorphomonas sp. SM30]GLS75004.1 dihydrolipoamide acetyltransferase [Oharaeibacter diazotrophicus]
MSTPLPHTVRGEADGRPPVVLLHGFAGDALGWTSVQLALERRRRSIAFDLPGHGRALAWPEIGHAGLAAKAVTASLDALDLPAVHLVGHSMGGAVAALIALRDPGRIASLTLVAPGGFGRDINHRLLRRFAAARAESEIAPLLEQFFGYSARLPRRMAAQIALGRDEPGRIEALTTVAEAILDGEGQRTVDRDGIGALTAPVRVIWGEDDRVLPVRQSEGLAGAIAVHRFAGVGHMPHLEVPSAVARVVAEQIATA